MAGKTNRRNPTGIFPPKICKKGIVSDFSASPSTIETENENSNQGHKGENF